MSHPMWCAGLRLLLAVGLVALGCAAASRPGPEPASTQAGPSASPTPPASGSLAAKPLTDCGVTPCPSFAESAKEMASCGASKVCVVANVGTCGPWSYTDEVRGWYTTLRYFDSAGRLFATCTANIEHGHPTCQGDLPKCDKKIVQQHGTAK